MFLVPAICALFSAKASETSHDGRYGDPRASNFTWSLVWLAITLLIGFRYEVGGDWSNYFRLFVSRAWARFGAGPDEVGPRLSIAKLGKSGNWTGTSMASTRRAELFSLQASSRFAVVSRYPG